VNYDKSLVVTITVTCYSWASSSGDHLFTWGAIYRPPHDTLRSEVQPAQANDQGHRKAAEYNWALPPDLS